MNDIHYILENKSFVFLFNVKLTQFRLYKFAKNRAKNIIKILLKNIIKYYFTLFKIIALENPAQKYLFYFFDLSLQDLLFCLQRNFVYTRHIMYIFIFF